MSLNEENQIAQFEGEEINVDEKGEEIYENEENGEIHNEVKENEE